MPLARRYRLPLVFGASAVLVVGIALVLALSPAVRQRAAVERLRALGAVVRYDYELPPECWDPQPVHEIVKKMEGITDRRELEDPDHDGRAWLRRMLGPDLFHDVVSVNLVYSYAANGKDRREPGAIYHEDMALLARFGKLRILLLKGGQACDLALEHLRGLDRLEMLYMWDAKVTDRGMESLRPLKRLRYLHLSNAGVSDAGLSCLGGLTELEGLVLQGNRLTDTGLIRLRGLTRLRQLWLCSNDDNTSRFSGPGLANLAGLTELEELALQSTGFADTCIERVAPFRKLEGLLLGGTALTAEGEKRLREVVPPGCHIDINRR